MESFLLFIFSCSPITGSHWKPGGLAFCFTSCNRTLRIIIPKNSKIGKTNEVQVGYMTLIALSFNPVLPVDGFAGACLLYHQICPKLQEWEFYLTHGCKKQGLLPLMVAQQLACSWAFPTAFSSMLWKDASQPAQHHQWKDGEKWWGNHKKHPFASNVHQLMWLLHSA